MAGSNLVEKIDHALDESRILVLGATVFLGFQLQGTFQPGFEQMPKALQYVKVGALVLVVVTLIFLMWPASHHRIVEQGEDSPGFHRFVLNVIGVALAPLALAIGLELYVASERVAAHLPGLLIGGAATGVACAFWYGSAAARNRSAGGETSDAEDDADAGRRRGAPDQDAETGIGSKVDHVLTEARVVLPGAQALLGFQFVVVLAPGFDALPERARYLHLVSLALMALTTILLITPAAYHRLAEAGEDTPRFHTVASRFIVAAMATFVLGTAGDLFVVVEKVTGSSRTGLFAAIGIVVLAYGLWFVYGGFRRTSRAPRSAGATRTRKPPKRSRER